MTTLTSYYTEEEKQQLDPNRVPHHIAIVPDGNRRWANSHEATVDQGHRSGADGLMDIMRSAKELGVKVVTIYTFSTENWKRSPEEVASLMWLIQTYLEGECQEMVDNEMKFETIGDLTPVPDAVKNTIIETKAATAHCDKITMVLAINYGSRDEIRRSVAQIIDDYSIGKVQKEDITESLIASHLDTARWPDPDLYIRTSGETRVSNYLLWQISYSELYFTDVLWPDFRPQHLLEAVQCFQNRKRRLGS